ncbi:hypothetical protein LWI28_005794 [Acer negundo]|uniref:Uncharacterized protein n=1 Tax=Acer negundo TaxID=4023 RepID=A0AAD5ICC1_ACENE|nr:hypothetical protein LWI28_005794 [Acer negundo]
MKTELDDIRTKVNFLYDKFNSAEDKNQDNNFHNTSNHHNSMHNLPPNPTPPLPSSRPLSNPTSQHHTIEVSSNNTRTLPQHQQTISKSTPSWMKAPSEPPLEDGNTYDLLMADLRNDDPYYVPLVLTVTSLVDEVKLKEDRDKKKNKEETKENGNDNDNEDYDDHHHDGDENFDRDYGDYIDDEEEEDSIKE